MNTLSFSVYTVSELSERWRVSDQAIRDLIADGQLRAFKVGLQWRIPASEVRRIENIDY